MITFFLCVGLVLIAGVGFVVLSMPRFFKSAPPRNEWFTKAVYELNVYMVLFSKEKHPIQKTLATYHIFAYVYTRLLALYQDIKTTGSNWDIVWSYSEMPKDAIATTKG